MPDSLVQSLKDLYGDDITVAHPAIGLLVDERELLHKRVVWLRHAYHRAWLRRRVMRDLMRDVYASRVRAKRERNDFESRYAECYIAGMAFEAQLNDVIDERDRFRRRVAWLRRAYGKLYRVSVETGRELTDELARVRAVVEAACSELDDIGARSGRGDIGVVVERLIDELGLSYPFDDEERA